MSIPRPIDRFVATVPGHPWTTSSSSRVLDVVVQQGLYCRVAAGSGRGKLGTARHRHDPGIRTR